jgi:hypothetical protein
VLSFDKYIYPLPAGGGGGLILVAAPLAVKPRTTAEMRLYKSVWPRAQLSRGRPRTLNVKPHTSRPLAPWIRRYESGAETSVDVGPPGGEEPLGGDFEEPWSRQVQSDNSDVWLTTVTV